MKKPEYVEFGAKVKAWMQDHCVSVSQLAARLEMAVSVVSSACAGKRPFPSRCHAELLKFTGLQHPGKAARKVSAVRTVRTVHRSASCPDRAVSIAARIISRLSGCNADRCEALLRVCSSAPLSDDDVLEVLIALTERRPA